MTSMDPSTVTKERAEPGVSWTALENTRLAYERTLMAWIRTAVSMISFGFTIYKFFQYVEKEQEKLPIQYLFTPRALGMFMISAGLITLLLASVEHWRCMSKLREQYTGRHGSLSLVLASVMVALGLMALIAAVFKQ